MANDVTASALKNVPFRLPPSATPGEDSLLQFLGCKFARRGIMAFSKNQYCIPVVDQFSGHLTPKVIGSTARKHPRAPIIR